MNRRTVVLGTAQPAAVRGRATTKPTPPVKMDQEPAVAVRKMLMSRPEKQSQGLKALRDTALRGESQQSSANTTVNTQRSEHGFAAAVQHMPISAGNWQ